MTQPTDSHLFDDTPPPQSQSWGVIAAIGVGFLLAVGLWYFVRQAGTSTRPQEVLSNTGDREQNLAFAWESFRGKSDIPGSDTARTVHYLNQWAELGGTSKQNWQRDEMCEAFSSVLDAATFKDELDRLDFTPMDVTYLRENVWLRSVNRWVLQQEPPRWQREWLEQQTQTVGPDVGEQLAAGLKLFDWTIRNIQLEALLPPPPRPTASAGNDPASRIAAMRGIPGPGYARTAWQTLLHGRGDAWQRARVFLLLARQAGIPGCMLALDSETVVGEYQPWAPALFINGQFYIFDTAIGLPLPGATEGSVATLKELVNNPALLRAWDVPGIGDYPIREEDLKRIVALVDASPFALANRMAALEQTLKGDDRLVLSVRPSEWAEKWKGQPGILRTRLWRVPLEAVLYLESSAMRRQRDRAFNEEYLLHYSMYDRPTPLMRGRNLHLLGVFESEEQQPGARALYLSTRPPDTQINRLAASETAQAELEQYGKLPTDEQARKATIKLIVATSQHAKENATYFLALTHFEQGKYELAAEWFRDRIIEGAEDSPWVPGARYNLGRAYEMQEQWALAREQYIRDELPQRQGSIVRSLMLQKRTDGK